MQTQWQWIKQLCLCVEQHVKENAAYFQVRRRGAPNSPGFSGEQTLRHERAAMEQLLRPGTSAPCFVSRCGREKQEVAGLIRAPSSEPSLSFKLLSGNKYLTWARGRSFCEVLSICVGCSLLLQCRRAAAGCCSLGIWGGLLWSWGLLMAGLSCAGFCDALWLFSSSAMPGSQRRTCATCRTPSKGSILATTTRA